MREAAGERFDQIELHALIGFCMFTDDPMSIVEPDGARRSASPRRRAARPRWLMGTVDSMVEELQWRREEWGISYVTIEGPWEEFAPVVGRLAGT